MTRFTSSVAQAAAEADHVDYAIFVTLDFGSETLYVCNCLSTVPFNGHTYLGAGRIGSIDKISESSDLQPLNPLQMSLSGIPGDYLQHVSDRNDYYGRSARVEFCLFDQVSQVINPTEQALWEGRMTKMTIERAPASAEANLVCEDRMAIWDKSNGLLNTDEHQELLFPGDKFLDQVALNKNRVVSWGGERIVAGRVTTSTPTTDRPSPR